MELSARILSGPYAGAYACQLTPKAGTWSIRVPFESESGAYVPLQIAGPFAGKFWEQIDVEPD